MNVRPRDAERHRRSEPFAPRPSDLLAARLRMLAAWAVRRDVALELEGRRWSGPQLEALAERQAYAEATLGDVWRRFRSFYEAYGQLRESNDRLLQAAIRDLDRMTDDVDARRTARGLKLRNPPAAQPGSGSGSGSERCPTSADADALLGIVRSGILVHGEAPAPAHTRAPT
jgi:hypothetical protein